MAGKMECFWILFLVYLTAFNSVECGDSDCRAIQSQDANDTTNPMGLFALSDDGIQNPVNEIHLVPESTKAFILTKDLDSLTDENIKPEGVTMAVVFNLGPVHMGPAPSHLETFLRSLQEKNSRLDTYYFYYGNTCDIWVAAIFDTVQKEDGFYKNMLPLEAEVYRVVRFNSVAQIKILPSSTIMLAPKYTMVYVNCNSDPTQLPALPTPTDVGKFQELKCQMKLLTEKLNQQEAALMENKKSFETELDTLKNSMKANENKLAELTSQDRLVYFTAGIQPGGKVYYRDNERIYFTKIITNIGNAYYNGRFLAPFDGIYEFSVNLVTTYDDHHDATGYLRVNGRKVAYINAEEVEWSFQAASVNVILDLKINDYVDVVADDIHGSFKAYAYYAPACLFSGKILAPR